MSFEVPQSSSDNEKVIHRFYASRVSIGGSALIELRGDHVLIRFGQQSGLDTQLPILDYRPTTIAEATSMLLEPMPPLLDKWTTEILAQTVITVLQSIFDELSTVVNYWTGENISLPSQAEEAILKLIEDKDEENDNVVPTADYMGRAFTKSALVEIVEVSMDTNTVYYIRLLPTPAFILPEITWVHVEFTELEEEIAILQNDALWYWQKTVDRNYYIASVTTIQHPVVIRMKESESTPERLYCYIVCVDYANVFESDELPEVKDWIEEQGISFKLFE